MASPPLNPAAARVAEVYRAAGPLGSAARYAGPSPMWPPQASAASRPYMVPSGPSKAPGYATVAPMSRAATGVALPVRIEGLSRPRSLSDDDSSSALLVPANVGSTADEGFFGKRQGEGRSSGGGPSSIALGQSGDVSALVQTISRSDVSASTRSVSRDEPTAPHLNALVSRSTGVASTCVPSMAATLPQPKRGVVGRQQGLRTTRSVDPPPQLSAPTPSMPSKSLLTQAMKSPQKPQAAESVLPTRRRISQTPSEQSQPSEGLAASLKGGRRGEGRSSGGGPSQLCLGGMAPDESSRSLPTDFDASVSSKRCVQSEAAPVPASPPIHSQPPNTASSAPVPSPVAESRWPPPKESFPDTDRNGQARPSYDELLAENRYLRDELAEARNELATFRRWYTLPS